MVAQTELRKAATAAALGLLCLLVIGTAMAANSGEVKTSGGLLVYLGVVPAEIVKGPSPHSAERPMHGYQVIQELSGRSGGTWNSCSP